MKYKFAIGWFIVLLLSGTAVPDAAHAQATSPAPLGVVNPETRGYRLVPPHQRLVLTPAQLFRDGIVGMDQDSLGLEVDLGDTTLFGIVYSGPFYFEYRLSDYLFPRYREASRLRKGRGVIRIKNFFVQWRHQNVNRWTDQGVMAYRLNLWRRTPDGVEPLGMYDACVRFKRKGREFLKGLTITEGPIVNLVTSDHPDWMVISLETDRPSRVQIHLSDGREFSDGARAIRHEVKIEGLQPNREYRYRVVALTADDTLTTPEFPFRSAPPKGAPEVVFAYTGDGRSGYGGGERAYLGVNQYTLRQIGAAVYRQGADFLLFGGDMINGFTDNYDDITMQFRAFKQSFFGFLVQRPLYTAVGNHEALLHHFTKKGARPLFMDKWPYDSLSVEAVFGRNFVHPENGPKEYPGTPPYRENVYSFTYGNVKIIVYNNNYWWTSHYAIPRFGGSPEGYILPNQMEWIRGELEAAEKDPKIHHVFLMAQEPVFPNGGHVKDAMWYSGDNTVRAYLARNGESPVPFEKGIVEVRNQFWELVSNSSKVVAVLGSDEHGYHRTLITRQTPVGLFPQDDLNGNGKLDDGQISPNPKFRYPTWFIVSGGAGAPYYVQEKTPWTEWVKLYSSNYNYLIFRVKGEQVTLEVYTLTGQLLDHEEDLRQVKRKQ